MIVDSSSTHITANVRRVCEENNFDLLLIPAGCTKYLQPLDLTVNRSFKAITRRNWADGQWTGDTRTEVDKFIKQSTAAWDTIQSSVIMNGFKSMCKFLGLSLDNIDAPSIIDNNTNSNLPTFAQLQLDAPGEPPPPFVTPKAPARNEKTHSKAVEVVQMYEDGKSIEDLQRHFNVKAPSTIYRWLKIGRLQTPHPIKKIGRPSLYNEEQVEFIKEQAKRMTQREVVEVFRTQYNKMIAQQTISVILNRK